MYEDKLTRAERIRLECFAQAVAAFGVRAVTAQDLMRSAEEIEAWLKEAKDGNADDKYAGPL